MEMSVVCSPGKESVSFLRSDHFSVCGTAVWNAGAGTSHRHAAKMIGIWKQVVLRLPHILFAGHQWHSEGIFLMDCAFACTPSVTG